MTRLYCTVWITQAELFAMLESPLYVTVTVVGPTVTVVVVNFAFPPLSWAVPRTVFPAVAAGSTTWFRMGDQLPRLFASRSTRLGRYSGQGSAGCPV